MIGLLRLVVFGFVGLSIVYLLVSVYSRSVERERLEKEWDAGGVDQDRDAYIHEGLKRYQHGLRRKLIALVYVIPAVVIAIIVYVVNHQ
ncbi:hypothetical protein L0V05_03085 [Tabrizicola sp. J26]|uniref:hypothetical protein n=1 Tax=Alitabrizicola rongguiensis TaxID=2909234 RepID=UPI001F38198D|nr:hypothetical protein [Tabrizicola rongguiensis]MCF1707795.1 hypothetical protein [Tabrizicola rongguiensis]